MDWLAATWDAWLTTLLWLAGLSVALGGLGSLMPCNRGMFWWRDLRSAATDLLYWFVTPVFVRIVRAALLAGAIGLFFGDAPVGFAAIRALPIWLQCAAILVLQDFLLYWLHRLFHTSAAWRFHAVHHSPTNLDWTAAARNHVVNLLFTFVLADVIVQLLGFAPAALFILAPVNILYSSFVHANLNWTFGPLRFLFASPVFHRWHHTLEAEGIDKNFASTFPLLDVAFGTFHMPPGKVPERFGNGDAEFPDDFWGQLVYPFVKSASDEEQADVQYDSAAVRGHARAEETAQPYG